MKIIAIERLTDDSANVTYRTASGLAERIVFADVVHHIRAVKPGLSFGFDAGPNAFLLAAEARRVRLAYLFDPQAALGTSDVQPLPHQLRAVYETMLHKQPLRYVLADDPGAGTTACPAEVAVARYNARPRHEVHWLKTVTLTAMDKYDRPVGIGSLITVDTTGPVDVASVAAEVRCLHASRTG